MKRYRFEICRISDGIGQPQSAVRAYTHDNGEYVSVKELKETILDILDTIDQAADDNGWWYNQLILDAFDDIYKDEK